MAANFLARRSLGQFFTPDDVACFTWDMVELLRGHKWNRGARVVDPACGDGVFLRVALERGQDPQRCFGFDIDETLVPDWQHQARLRGARMCRANGLADDPTIDLMPASFDLVIGNPPFSGRGLRHLMQLIHLSAAKASERQRAWPDEQPTEPAVALDNGTGPTITRQKRAILDQLARQLSGYACWRLRDESNELSDDLLRATSRAGLLADLDRPAEGPVRSADHELTAQAVAEWPADRALDLRQPKVRDAIRRIASTAIEVFFTERFVQLAKPGGLIAVIVPGSILASDSLAPFRRWLMGQIQLLAVIGLPQKVFTGAGAKAKTGIVFARRYTTAEQEANAAGRHADALRLAPVLRREKVLMVAPEPAIPNWTLEKYLAGILEATARRQASASRKGVSW